MLNAQLIAVSNCKASRQFHSYHSCLGDVHRLIVLNDLCILGIGIAVQFNLVCRICGGRYHAVLRSDLQRQLLVFRVIRGRLNLQRGLNVQLLIIALYSSCLFNQSICSIFIDILNDIARFRAEGRCRNRCRCCCNLFLICLRNLVYLNFRLGNRRLDLNIAGFGLCNYLVAVTGYITGSGNVAACNVCARVGGEVAAGDGEIHTGVILRRIRLNNTLNLRIIANCYLCVAYIFLFFAKISYDNRFAISKGILKCTTGNINNSITNVSSCTASIRLAYYQSAHISTGTIIIRDRMICIAGSIYICGKGTTGNIQPSCVNFQAVFKRTIRDCIGRLIARR